jgi:hypothetical protein
MEAVARQSVADQAAVERGDTMPSSSTASSTSRPSAWASPAAVAPALAAV